jgi:hypothetical protein
LGTDYPPPPHLANLTGADYLREATSLTRPQL